MSQYGSVRSLDKLTEAMPGADELTYVNGSKKVLFFISYLLFQ